MAAAVPGRASLRLGMDLLNQACPIAPIKAWLKAERAAERARTRSPPPLAGGGRGEGAERQPQSTKGARQPRTPLARPAPFVPAHGSAQPGCASANRGLRKNAEIAEKTSLCASRGARQARSAPRLAPAQPRLHNGPPQAGGYQAMTLPLPARYFNAAIAWTIVASASALPAQPLTFTHLSGSSSL